MSYMLVSSITIRLWFFDIYIGIFEGREPNEAFLIFISNYW